MKGKRQKLLEMRYDHLVKDLFALLDGTTWDTICEIEKIDDFDLIKVKEIQKNLERFQIESSKARANMKKYLFLIKTQDSRKLMELYNSALTNFIEFIEVKDFKTQLITRPLHMEKQKEIENDIILLMEPCLLFFSDVTLFFINFYYKNI